MTGERDLTPEDKDLKRIVRARMADTGERYTRDRAGLGPEEVGLHRRHICIELRLGREPVT